MDVWAKSIAGGAPVKIYGSRNNTDFRLLYTLTTDTTTMEVHKNFENAYPYIRVVIEETGTGTSEIEIVASR